MSDQQALAAGADAQQSLVNSQVGIFLFDLSNEAKEHGFKTNESWALELATEAEVKGLKKTNHPVISLRLQPQTLLKVYQQVKDRLRQPLSKTDQELTVGELSTNEKSHLVAYPVRLSQK